jgi:tripartite-type tricarboxylate transporter receptor subunit TctC
MKKLGLDIHIESPDYFKDVIQNDFDRWGKLTKDIGFKQL